jgi:hypothetical protein
LEVPTIRRKKELLLQSKLVSFQPAELQGRLSPPNTEATAD